VDISSVNVLPSPIVLWKVMESVSASASAREMWSPRPVPSTGRVFGPVIRSNAVNSRCWSINLPYASAGSVNLAVPRDPRSTSSRCKARADTVAALDAR
jgi:hypothetical protein